LQIVDCRLQIENLQPFLAICNLQFAICNLVNVLPSRRLLVWDR